MASTKTKPRSERASSKPNLQPLDDHLVVRPHEPDEITASGLVIPDTARDRPQRGTVLAIGPGRRSEHTGERISIDVSVGSTVVYAEHGGTEIKYDGEDLLILASRDVLAIVADNGTKQG